MEESVARSLGKSRQREVDRRQSGINRQSSEQNSEIESVPLELLDLAKYREGGKRLSAVDSQLFQCEELRVVWGTRGNPGTVAPFRAWRGSRDLVAQSPKLHAPAVANCSTAET